MRHQRHVTITLLLSVALACLLVVGCAGPKVETQQESTEAVDTNADPTGMGQLLTDMVNAYESPESGAADSLEADLQVVQEKDPADYDVARAVTEHWRRVYLDPSYTLCLWGGGEYASELEGSQIADSSSHAIVVLGYELKDGEMTDELKGRCDAAAAVARTYPNTLLVCSGGATGKNNTQNHTEAGLMKGYLTEVCGIDGARILTDERAMTTAENALNTLEMLEGAGVRTMTIVTSSYHQRWGQVVYAAVAARYAQQRGYDVQIVGDYSYDISPENPVYKKDDRIAVMQIAQIMGLPEETIAMLPAIR